MKPEIEDRDRWLFSWLLFGFVFLGFHLALLAALFLCLLAPLLLFTA